MKIALACMLSLGLMISCASPAAEKVGSSSSKIDSRFDPGYPAPYQTDAWSCSVHTTTWMLRATGHDVTHGQIGNRMLSTGRVTTASGLSDASGPGLAATLRDYEGGAQIQNQAYASFDEVAAKAGHMAVGVGGRAWNHWSAVRGYDAGRDVILLANSAPAWKGVGQELTRGEFAALGGMAMVWMDFGQVAPPPPFEPAPRPTGGPFPALHVKGPIPGGQWLTQCNESADGERVWQTDGQGPDIETRWAAAQYPQSVTTSCGEQTEGTYPIVLRSFAAGEFGAWITECTGNGEGLQQVYRIQGDVDGHPAAVFQYNEQNPDCE
jgi:hypothetical protein